MAMRTTKLIPEIIDRLIKTHSYKELSLLFADSFPSAIESAVSLNIVRDPNPYLSKALRRMNDNELIAIASNLYIDTDVFIIQPVKSKSQPVKPREPFRPASDFATAPAVKPATPLPTKSDNNSLIVKAFISHSTKDKQFANKIRKIFKGYGIIAFVSDEDIKGGEVWQERIRKEIKEMHVFIAMHTDDFSESLWCQQETGLALARETEVEIIPINFNKGKPLDSFLTNFQYIKRGAKSTAKIVKEILDRLKTSDKTKELYFAKIADKVAKKLTEKPASKARDIFAPTLSYKKRAGYLETKKNSQTGMNLGKRPDELI